MITPRRANMLTNADRKELKKLGYVPSDRRGKKHDFWIHTTLPPTHDLYRITISRGANGQTKFMAFYLRTLTKDLQKVGVSTAGR